MKPTLSALWAIFALHVYAISAAQPELHWFRGNIHTHTLNSDGNAAPDAVVRWYREHGYQFVVITDHEFLTDVAPLHAVFGAEGKFLVMKGQEITQVIADLTHPDGTRQAHLNAINASRVVIPLGEGTGIGRTAPRGTTVAQTYARNIAEIRAAGGIAQINHPNFRWSVGVEDMTQLPDGHALRALERNSRNQQSRRYR
jgi:hypothetical protein